MYLGSPLPTTSSDLPGSMARRATSSSAIWSCSRWGLPCRSCHQERGELLPHHFTLTPIRTNPFPDQSGGAVSFLWHFPWDHSPWPLTSTLPCGARTFLEPPESMIWKARDCLPDFSPSHDRPFRYPCHRNYDFPASRARLAKASACPFRSRLMCRIRNSSRPLLRKTTCWYRGRRSWLLTR